MSAVSSVLPGLLLCALLATGGFVLAEVPMVKESLHLGALLLVILLGMGFRSAFPIPSSAVPGIQWAQRPVLRWAVAGLGFRLSFGELLAIGGPALVVVVLSTATALGFAWWLARQLQLPEKMGLLLGVGGAICGASAIVAADSVIRAERRDVAVSLAIITFLGTVGILAYPPLAAAVHMSDFFAGVWIGASLHEMAQVVAAGFGVSDEAMRVATVVKLARIALLAPVIFFLVAMRRRVETSTGASSNEVASARVALVPWFLVLFIAFAAINSLGVLPPPLLEALRRADVWLLCVGMAGVGLQTGFGDVLQAGWKPVAVGVAQWVVLAATSYLLAAWVC